MFGGFGHVRAYFGQSFHDRNTENRSSQLRCPCSSTSENSGKKNPARSLFSFFMCVRRKLARVSSDAILRTGVWAFCLFVGCLIGTPLTLVGVHQVKIVQTLTGDLTNKTYDTFNYTLPSYICDPTVAQSELSSSGLPTTNYHLYFEVEFPYNGLMHTQNACAPTPGKVRGMCDDGTSHELDQPGPRGPTSCDVYVDSSLDWFNGITIQTNRTLWLVVDDNLRIYMEDPGEYSWHKVIAAIVFLAAMLVCFFGLIWECGRGCNEKWGWKSTAPLVLNSRESRESYDSL
jgi:hypothetical protein